MYIPVPMLAVIEYDGIDTSAKNVNVYAKNRNVGVFYYSAGASNNTNAAVSRQKEIYFKDFVYPAAATLPVRYASFDATVIASSYVKVVLQAKPITIILKWSVL